VTAVPADDAERLDELEDAYWSARARAVLAKGEPTIPWDDVREIGRGL
jgi:hypothetical protein